MKRRGAKNCGAPWANRSKCPECGRDLVERKNRKDNSKFIGCTGFPKHCRYTREYTRKMWKDEPKTYNADWRVAERSKARQLQKSGDIHCPRCDIGLLKIQTVEEQAFVGCDRAACDYREDYGQESTSQHTEESA